MPKNLIIKSIFIALLTLLPYFIGGFYSSIPFVEVFNSACFVFIFFTPYIFIQHLGFKRIFWFLFVFILFSWSLLESGHWLQEKSRFNHLDLKVLYESNTRELIEYFTAIIPIPIVILLVIGIVLVLYKLINTKHELPHFSKANYKIFLAVLAFAGLYYLFVPKYKYQYAGIFYNEVKANKQLQEYYKKLELAENKIDRFLIENPISHEPSKHNNTYVLIIGESSSKHHFGIYNYWRNTTPRLSARKDIHIYNDIISTNTSTIECLGKALTIKPKTDTIQDLSCPTIVDLANNAGIKTFWLSNQDSNAYYKNSIYESAKRASVVHYTNTDDGNILKKDLPKHDGLLLPLLNQALKDSSKNKLIVLHMMGTHFKFNQRYPASFNVFKNTDSVKSKMPFANNKAKQKNVNAYDNAVLYNDAVLDSIFNLLDTYKHHTPISAIYFSDHADEVYDYRDFIGHNPKSDAAYLHEIPLITWNFTSAQSVQTNAPYQMNRMIFSLMDWMDLKAHFFYSKHSLFNKRLETQARFLGNGQPYIKSK